MKKYFYLVLLIIFVGLFFFLPRIFKINHIYCQTQFGKCSQEIEGRINKLEGSTYRNIGKNIDNLLVDNPSIKSYLIQVKLPNSIFISFTVKNPIFSINQKDTKNYIFTDLNGLILTIGNETNLPTLIVNEKLGNIGESINQKYLFALRLIQGLNLMYQINSGEIKNDSLIVELPPSINVIFPLEGNSDTLLGSIRLIYEKIQNGYDGKIYDEVDLRFKNPVLR